MPDRNDDGEENVTPGGDDGGDDDGDKIHIPDNEIHYVAPEKIEPNGSEFGAGYVSNEWDAATGKGIITFDGPVTTIGDWAFVGCSSLTEITLPEGVTTIGYGHSLIAAVWPQSIAVRPRRRQEVIRCLTLFPRMQ